MSSKSKQQAIIEPQAVAPIDKNAPPPGFIDFRALLLRVPYGERATRGLIGSNIIPHIRVPHGRRLIFHWPSVEKALLRYQKGGIEN